MDRILFRVDGNESIGMGHIFRMVTLAKAILKIEPNTFIIFLINNSNFVIKYLDENGFKSVTSVSQIVDNEKMFISDIINQYKISKIIIDKFDVKINFMDWLRTTNIQIIQFFNDDSSLNADVGINPNVGYQNLQSKNFSNDTILTGNKFVLIDEKFCKNQIKLKKNVKTIFISSGAGDKNNITSQVIELINSYFKFSDSSIRPVLNIIIGPVFSNIYNIIEEVINSNLKINLIFNHFDLSSIMKNSDIAISSVGITVYELLTIGIPVIGIQQSTDQVIVSKYLEEKGCILNLGHINQIKTANFFQALDEINHFHTRVRMVHSSQKLFDGKGAQRCAIEILNSKKSI